MLHDVNVALLIMVVMAMLIFQCCGRVSLEAGDESGDESGGRGWVLGSRMRERRSGHNASTESLLSYESGTTANLREIFLGRCFGYQCKYCADDYERSYDCLALWQIFNSSFSFREECTSTPDDFDDYVKQAFIPIPQHQTLFYSGMYSFAMKLGKISSDYINIERTLLGSLIDGTTFCGQPDSPGINYERCRKFGNCVNETQAAFWKKSSKHFAGGATGNVTVILDGNRKEGAYRPTSFFRSVEVPRIDVANVTSLTAFVVHALDGIEVERCVTGTLLELQQDMKAKGIQFNCVDNPSITRHIQCVNDPEHDLCKSSCTGSGVMVSVPWIMLIFAFLLRVLL